MTVRFGADLTYFLWSVGIGFIFSLIYDFVRAVRNILKASDIIVNITDIVLLIICGFAVIIEAYFINNGELRLYSVLCIVFVFVLYRLIIGNRLSAPVEKLITILVKGVIWVWRMICVPIKFAVKFLKKTACITERIYSKINIKK